MLGRFSITQRNVVKVSEVEIGIQNMAVIKAFFFSGSCADLLGLGWDNKFPDSAFTASSQLSPGNLFLTLVSYRF